MRLVLFVMFHSNMPQKFLPKSKATPTGFDSDDPEALSLGWIKCKLYAKSREWINERVRNNLRPTRWAWLCQRALFLELKRHQHARHVVELLNLNLRSSGHISHKWSMLKQWQFSDCDFLDCNFMVRSKEKRISSIASLLEGLPAISGPMRAPDSYQNDDQSSREEVGYWR